MKFLIVDDSKFSRSKIAAALEELGYKAIGEAADGEEAAQKFKELSPDIVTMDFEMPKLDGLEASKLILSQEPNAKIILITSTVDKKELTAALRIGIKKVLNKPLNTSEFEAAIKELI